MSAKTKPAAVAKDTLDRIEADAAALDALLFETGGDLSDGADAAIEGFFAELDERRRAKVDGYGWRILQARLDVAKWKGLANEYEARAKRAGQAEAFLLGKMTTYLEGQGLDQIAGDVHTLAFQANGGKAPVVLDSDDPAAFPAECVVTTQAISKTAVAEALERRAQVLAAEPDAKLPPIPAHYGKRGRSLRLTS